MLFYIGKHDWSKYNFTETEKRMLENDSGYRGHIIQIEAAVDWNNKCAMRVHGIDHFDGVTDEFHLLILDPDPFFQIVCPD